MNDAIWKAVPTTLANQTIEWVSPLASDDYAEYRDRDFLDKIRVTPGKRSLEGFWPQRGPVWDGLARTSEGEVLLIEAKSHIPEAVTSPSGAQRRSSRNLIDASLQDTKHYLDGNPDADWSGIFYQVTNRLAHLYLLRVLNEIPAHLLFVYFVGDPTKDGPDSVDEWKGAVRTIETFLGVVGRTKLSRFMHHVYVNVNEVPAERQSPL